VLLLLSNAEAEDSVCVTGSCLLIDRADPAPAAFRFSMSGDPAGQCRTECCQQRRRLNIRRRRFVFIEKIQ
jgi:hypothetical protein